MKHKTLALCAIAASLTTEAAGAQTLGLATPVVSPPPGAPASFADLVQRVAPAVVSIEVTSQTPVKDLLAGSDDPFTLKPENASPGEPIAKAKALCSGFFIAANGYLVTNNHCVRNATEVKVTLNDGRDLGAKVIGVDAPTDLAVLKVDGAVFPFISFAGASRPRVGDWAIAIGNPFGLNGTATAGIVSASGREIGANFNDFIQIDTPINRGNSGGPTFDTSGRVIGVNTIIFSENGDSVGIGFAIPSDTAQAVTHQLIDRGSVTRGYLGATIQDLAPEIADSLALVGRKGAVIAELAPAGPAARAGLRQGDVVVALDGRPLASSTDLTRRVALSAVGQSLTLDIVREGRAETLRVVSGARPSDQQLASAEVPAGGEADKPSFANGVSSLGMTFGALDEASRRRYGLDDRSGAVIDRVEADSEAALKGLQQGIVVFRAGDRAVHAPADIKDAVASARQEGRDSILLGVRVGRRTAFLALKLTRQD